MLKPERLISPLMMGADQLMAEYGAITTTLPQKGFAGGYLLPFEQLPPKFGDLRGHFRHDPELVMRMDGPGKPSAIVLSWGDMSHAIIVYARPPVVPPQGFAVRGVGDRIYVIAHKR